MSKLVRKARGGAWRGSCPRVGDPEPLFATSMHREYKGRPDIFIHASLRASGGYCPLGEHCATFTYTRSCSSQQ